MAMVSHFACFERARLAQGWQEWNFVAAKFSCCANRYWDGRINEKCPSIVLTREEGVESHNRSSLFQQVVKDFEGSNRGGVPSGIFFGFWLRKGHFTAMCFSLDTVDHDDISVLQRVP
jgi:hypothetical protein